jgi:UDPglucose 6-dehydrogenase
MTQSNQKIAILGTGYVGLVAGTCFSDKGNEVACIDLNHERINLLKSGKIPFYEPGLEDMIKRNVSANRLKFSILDETSLNEFDAIFVSVGTPDDGSGKTDLTQVKNAVNYIVKNVTSPKIIVIRSTVPAGTCELLQSEITNLGMKHLVCSNPEFTKEGDAINDFMNPDRVVVGGPDLKEIKEFFISLYTPFTQVNHILFMSTQSSELTKYSSNAFLATRISFINDIARIASKLNADIGDVSNAIGMDQRIGPYFLNAGIGYGGSCFPKDTLSLVDQARAVGENINVLEGTIKTNDYQILYFVDKIINYFDEHSLQKTITLLGLSFKPNTDDVRESRGVLIYELLKGKGFTVNCYDPMDLNFIHDSIPYSRNMEDVLSNSSALVISVEDEAYAKIDITNLKKNGLKVIFDGRNILEKRLKGTDLIDYFCI